MDKDTVSIPVTRANGQTWVLLKHISDSWIMRAMKMDQRRSETKEAHSGHKTYEISAKGSVRRRPKKEWDIVQYMA